MEKAPIQAWVWNAVVLYWRDGDTVVLDIDKGFHETLRKPVRLAGENTPELRDPDPVQAARALEAKIFSEKLAPPGAAVILRTHKSDDKFGRLLGDVWCKDVHVNAALLESKLAIPEKR